MIQPSPYKYVCPKCGYSKVVRPKSDVLNPLDLMDKCPKCSSKMGREKLSFFDNLLSGRFGLG